MSLMTSADARAIELFDSLPTQTKRNLRKRGIRIEDLESITGALTVKNMIHAHFQVEASLRTQLAREKFKLGYCGGQVTCLTFIGKNAEFHQCEKCRKEQAAYRAQLGEKGARRNRRSEYGQMRAKERADEREKGEKE
jgi:hypothetical protein